MKRNHDNLIRHTGNSGLRELPVCNSVPVVRAVGLIASAAAGACWLAALFLPWTAAGALSSASLLDAIELVRTGTVDAVVPRGTAVVLLVPAAAGILLIGVAGLAGRVAATVRAAALLVGAIGSLVLAWRLTDGDLLDAGPGAWTSSVGVLLAAVALGCAAYPRGARGLGRHHR